MVSLPNHNPPRRRALPGRRSAGRARTYYHAGMFRNRFVVWDLDGTLLDTLDDIAAAANAARTRLGGEPLPASQIRLYVGEGAEQLMNRVMGEDRPADVRLRAKELFFEHYSRALAVHTRPYPGVDGIVRALRGRQAIATNKPGNTARALVEHCGWGGLFTRVVGGGDLPERKPSAAPALRALDGTPPDRAVFVGDSRIDLDTARAAGMPAVLVSWGFRPREELEGADAIADSAGQLAEFLGV